MLDWGYATPSQRTGTLVRTNYFSETQFLELYYSIRRCCGLAALSVGSVLTNKIGALYVQDHLYNRSGSNL